MTDTPEPQETRQAWRDINTAPKDGTPILGFMPSYYQNTGGQSVIMWMDGQWFDNVAFATTPTHWMPLPPTPSSPFWKDELEWICKSCGCQWHSNVFAARCPSCRSSQVTIRKPEPREPHAALIAYVDGLAKLMRAYSTERVAADYRPTMARWADELDSLLALKGE